VGLPVTRYLHRNFFKPLSNFKSLTMKKIFYSLSLLLTFGAITLNASAQSGAPVTGNQTLPGTNIKTPNMSTPVQIPEEKQSGSAAVQVTPNPSNGHFMVRFNSPSGGKTGVTVKNSEGGGMLAIEIMAKAGSNAVPVDIAQYGPGTYSVIVSGPGVYGTVAVVVNKK
jgi:hypothetical protein